MRSFLSCAAGWYNLNKTFEIADLSNPTPNLFVGLMIRPHNFNEFAKVLYKNIEPWNTGRELWHNGGGYRSTDHVLVVWDIRDADKSLFVTYNYRDDPQYCMMLGMLDPGDEYTKLCRFRIGKFVNQGLSKMTQTICTCPRIVRKSENLCDECQKELAEFVSDESWEAEKPNQQDHLCDHPF